MYKKLRRIKIKRIYMYACLLENMFVRFEVLYYVL